MHLAGHNLKFTDKHLDKMQNALCGEETTNWRCRFDEKVTCEKCRDKKAEEIKNYKPLSCHKCGKVLVAVDIQSLSPHDKNTLCVNHR